MFQDMFPTKKEYLTEYKQSGKTVQLKENNDLNELTKQAYAVVGLLMKGVKFNKTQPNVKRILEKLSEDNKIQKELSQFMNDNPELKPERAHRSKTNDRGVMNSDTPIPKQFNDVTIAETESEIVANGY
ncbi:hypothetical protein ab3b_00079 [Weissella cibaria]|uniref:Uncharacterized protein n=1 Tax=Weissella cibaria TaxID=137591 RepID=A0A0D1M4H1_9LACO|nr:hypothetical protein ab3b_00079 [Weissella cibaria]